MEPVNNTTHNLQTMQTQTENNSPAKRNPLFLFMGIGSIVYAFFYTFCLYKNSSGITYPFFVGGTCLFFFFYLKKSGTAVKKFSLFPTVSLVLLGISTCLTDSWVLLFFNKLGIFLLFFYMALHSLYQDKDWDLSKYLVSLINLTCTSLAFIFRPFTDFIDFLKSRQKQSGKTDGKGKYVFFGILIALPLLLVIIALLCSADAVFSNIFEYLFSDFFEFLFDGNIWGIAALFLFAFFASYCLLCRFSHRNIQETVKDKRTLEPIIGVTFTGMISLVYLIFCLVQIVYLFGGLGTLPQNYSYAQYAREGFFQLVFVCLINLALVLFCNKRFRRNKMLKGILVFISLCTYIMIASSAYRMILYISAYHLTFLRVLVLWGLIVIFLLISGTLAIIFHEHFPLVKYCVITVTVMYLIFSFAHPDYWIARYNLSHVDTTESGISSSRSYSDFYYLRNLSMDAAPAIYEKTDELGYDSESTESLHWFYRYSAKIVRKSWEGQSPKNTLPQKQSIRKFNFSRWTAYQYYTRYYKEHEHFQKDIVDYVYNF
ncbi:MAG: DUF4173 domain-containing protein [Lachnospiraceae bacterium]|nr:DUF4173 domain-containing protein [Lachnospiraceae bacterium]